MILIVSACEMFVPQMTLFPTPPIASASDVFGLRLEKVAALEGVLTSTGRPF